jgi:hypothetical protein
VHQLQLRNCINLRSSLLVVGALGIIGCTAEPPVVDPDPLPPLARIVVGEAANKLDNHGRFVLNAPLDLPYPQITMQQAADLADAFQKEAVLALLTALEKMRGGGINPNSMKICGRIFYAEPAIEALPNEVAPAIRRALGPYWIANYCGSSGYPEVAFAVSAYATNLRIEGGKIIYPRLDGGGYFRAIGIPKDRRKGVTGEPEVAAAEVAAVSGSSIAKVPRLVFIPDQIAPEVALWLVEIERPVIVRRKRTGGNAQASRIYFTDDMRWGHRGSWIAQDEALTQFEYHWAIPSAARGVAPIFRKGIARVRSGLALRIEPVSEVVK